MANSSALIIAGAVSASTRRPHRPYDGHGPAALPSAVPPLMDVSSASGLLGLAPLPMYRYADAATHEWIVIGHIPWTADARLFCMLLRALAPSVDILAGYPGTRRTSGQTRNTGLWFVLVSTAHAAFLRAAVAGRVVCHAIDGQAATGLTYRGFPTCADAAAYSDPKSFVASHARRRGQLRLAPVTVEPPKGPVPQYVIDAQDLLRQPRVADG